MENNIQPEIRFSSFSKKWEQKKIGDFYIFKNGLNKEKEFFGSGTPIVNFTDVFHNRRIFFEQLRGKVQLSTKEIQNYNVKQGDIFFTRTSETINEIGFPSVMINDAIDTVFSGFVLRGRAVGEDPLTLNFKSYVFFTASFREEMKKKSSMTTRALTSGTAIKEMFFNFPENKEEQRKIGKFFRDLDDTISLHQQELDALKQTKQGFLQKMFSKDGETTPEIRFSEFTADWTDEALENHVTILTGGTPKTNNTELWFPKEVPWLSSGEVNKKRIRYTNNKISKKGLNSSSARWVESHSVLIALAGQGKTRGTVAINEIPLTTNQSIAALTPKKSLDAEFLYQSLGKRYEELRMVSSGGGTRGGLNKKILSELIIQLTNIEEQVEIGKFFKQIDQVIELKEKEIKSLNQTKQGFLQKMFV